jgi:RNA polymerase sigma-70 factor (ECF subfamily)
VPAESVESAGPVESVEDEPDLDEIEATGMAEIEAAPAPERRAAAGPPPDDIAELVAAAVEGNRRATNELLAYIEPRIRRYCRGRIGRYERSHASADDVAQEVLFAVLKALPKYKERGRPFLAFVYGIAHNKVADAHRMSHRNRSDPYEEVPDSADVGGGPEALALAGELQGRLGKMLDKLQKNQRDILLYRVVVGLSAEETAETVGSTAGAVRVAQHRALQKLRQMLAAEVDL